MANIYIYLEKVDLEKYEHSYSWNLCYMSTLWNFVHYTLSTQPMLGLLQAYKSLNPLSAVWAWDRHWKHVSQARCLRVGTVLLTKGALKQKEKNKLLPNLRSSNWLPYILESEDCDTKTTARTARIAVNISYRHNGYMQKIRQSRFVSRSW